MQPVYCPNLPILRASWLFQRGRILTGKGSQPNLGQTRTTATCTARAVRGNDGAEASVAVRSAQRFGRSEGSAVGREVASSECNRLIARPWVVEVWCTVAESSRGEGSVFGGGDDDAVCGVVEGVA